MLYDRNRLKNINSLVFPTVWKILSFSNGSLKSDLGALGARISPYNLIGDCHDCHEQYSNRSFFGNWGTGYGDWGSCGSQRRC